MSIRSMRAGSTLIAALIAACSADTSTLSANDAGGADGDASALDAGTAIDGGEPIDAGSLAEIGAAIVRGECAFAARCLVSYFDYRFPSADACVAEQGRGIWRNMSARLEAGRAELDPGAVDACLTALETGDCKRSETWSACDALVRGTRALGEGCTSKEECVSGACLGVSEGCGVCVDPIPLGGSCEVMTLNGCGSGYCYTRLAGTEARCVPIAVREGDPCSGNYSECASPLVCERQSPDGGMCRAFPSIGEECSVGSPGLGCYDQEARCVDGVCKALVFGEAGASCDHVTSRCHGMCIQEVCVDGSPVGAVCGNAAPSCVYSVCAFDRICHARSGEGESCDGGLECQDGLECLGSPRRCTTRPWDFCL